MIGKKIFPAFFLFAVFVLISCGSPNEPAEFSENDGGYKIKSTLRTFADANDVLAEDTLVYVAQGEGGLLIASIKDVENPETIAVLTENVRGYSYKLAKLDSIIYIAAGSFGVTTINVADPANARTEAYNLSMKPAKGIYISEGYLFIAISERGIKIASLSYPPEPDIRGGFPTPGYAQDLTVTSDGDTAFVANGEMGLAVFDISNFAGGFGEYPQIGWIDTDGYAENVALDETNKIAYVTSGTAGVYSIDYSDVSAMKIIDRYDTEGYAKDLILDGDRLCVTSENGGVYFFEISNDGKLRKIGRVKTDDARGIASDENNIYVADKERGVLIIEKP